MKVLNLYTTAKYATENIINNIKNNNITDYLVLTDSISLAFDKNIKNALQITVNIDNDFKKKSYETILNRCRKDIAWCKENHHGVNWYYFTKQYLDNNIVCVNDVNKSCFIGAIERNI